ncbi:MAG: 50S ribosomal protein L22 [Acidimicrobiales bacterium]|jgi:large subunit ribosomal protein L22
MTGPKTNERPGTRATLRGYHMSASKARVVLNLIRGEDVTTAREILASTTREAADVVGKVLASAVANAVNNDALNAEELYVSAAFADEGITMKRFTPRARGRAGAIRKRSCHITVIVSRLDPERLEALRASRSAQATASRARRVSTSRRRADQTASLNKRESTAAAAAENEALEAEAREAEIRENESFDHESAIESSEPDVVTDAGEDSAQVKDEVADAETEQEPELEASSDESNETVSEDTTEETN